VSASARFCGACGTPVTAAATSPPPPSSPITAPDGRLSNRGFLTSLFDLSFSSLVTTKVVKFVYVLTLVAIGLTALVFVIGAFSRSAAAGALMLLIVAPLVSLFYAVYARVFLEFIIAVFRIAEYQRDLLALAQRESARAADLGSPSALSVPVSGD
jgi:hypothetical protein